jgi:AraC-like DNA-binding protein
MIVIRTLNIDNLRQLPNIMLNDFFITRDVIGFLQNYVNSNNIHSPAFQKQLIGFSAKQHMSYAQWWQLLEDLKDIHPKAAIGIDIGQAIHVEHCGVLGYLFRTSRNVGEALNCFKRFQRLIYAGSQAHSEANGLNEISLVWNPDFGYSSQTSDELLLAAMINITREIISPAILEIQSVSFTQAIPKDELGIYESFFLCEVLHEQQRLSITFSMQDLLTPIRQEDPTLHTILGKQAEELLNQLPDNDTFLAELRDTIIRCLHEGQASATHVAEHLKLSNRTLHRRLKAKNKIYKDILQDIRKSMSINYLSDDKLTLTEISMLLGYSEQSSFTRAFTKWHGYSPLQYRLKSTASH